jgi:hypothetical protein
MFLSTADLPHQIQKEAENKILQSGYKVKYKETLFSGWHQNLCQRFWHSDSKSMLQGIYYFL